MRHKQYIRTETIRREPDARILEEQDKIARIYAKAKELGVKIGKDPEDDKKRNRTLLSGKSRF